MPVALSPPHTPPLLWASPHSCCGHHSPLPRASPIPATGIPSQGEEQGTPPLLSGRDNYGCLFKLEADSPRGAGPSVPSLSLSFPCAAGLLWLVGFCGLPRPLVLAPSPETPDVRDKEGHSSQPCPLLPRQPWGRSSPDRHGHGSSRSSGLPFGSSPALGPGGCEAVPPPAPGPARPGMCLLLVGAPGQERTTAWSTRRPGP